MTVAYAAEARATFGNLLDTLAQLAAKAQAAGMGTAILEAKLAEDMFPLELQFRVAANQPLLALMRNCRREVPLDGDAYATLEIVGERIAAIGQLIAEAGDEEWLDADAEIDFTLPNGQRFTMSAAEHIRDWIAPNLYFHTTMAYAILRHRGLPLGKFEFVPQMARYLAPPPG